MATYLQGVTDYIPQFQPFQPDLNYYNQVLNTKQTQYDTNYKALNNIYSQYFYADLTHDDNIKRKDELFKNINFNLKKISGLDLSLEQNVTQAEQVFKPFYEDKYLMKDIAFTKNYNAQVSKAESFRNSDDAEQRSRYWEDGMKELEYRRQEFKNSDIAETLNIQNTRYTDYVNVQEKALKVVKDAGLSVENVEFSPDGRWIIKNTNGEQLIEPLSKLLEAQLGNDPAIQAVYKTQAYVNRKDYGASNAGQFNGDANAAEMKYLEDNYNLLKEQSQRRYKMLQDNSVSYNNKIADIKKQIAAGNKNPELTKALAQYEQGKQINDSVLERADAENKLMEERSSTTTTSTGFENPYGDIKSLRWKVDNGVASMLMRKDLDESAEVFAYRNAKQDIDANPYAVKAEEHAYRMQEVALRNQATIAAAKMRNKSDRDNTILKAKLDSGNWEIDENTGELVPVAAYQTVTSALNSKGTATKPMNLKQFSNQIKELQTEQIAKPYMTNVLDLLESFGDKISPAEIKNILGEDLASFNNKLNRGGYKYLTGTLGAQKLNSIKVKFNNWLSTHKNLSGMNSSEYNSYVKSAMKLGDYVGYLQQEEKWRMDTSKAVEADLKRKGFKYAHFLYDDKGNLRTEKEFITLATKYGGYKPETTYDVNNVIVKNNIAIGGNMYTMGTTNNKPTKSVSTPESILYNSMVGAAAKAYTNSKVVGNVSTKLPGISQMGELSGTGIFTPKQSEMWVNPKGHSPNTYRFNQVMQDLDRFDFDNTKNYRVSLMGPTKSGWDANQKLLEDSDNKVNRNDLGKQMMNIFKAEMSNTKTKMLPFRVAVNPVAANDPTKAAITIYPDAELLKEYTYSRTQKGVKSGAGFISPEAANQMAANGITYIMDASEMSNELYTSAFQDPLAVIASSRKGGYTYTDPADPRYMYNAKPSKAGSGDFTITYSYPVYNPNTGETIVDEQIISNSTLGTNLTLSRERITDFFAGQKQTNYQNSQR